MTNINDMVKFFQRLLLERAKKYDEANGLKLNRPHGRTPGTGGDSRDGRRCSSMYSFIIFRELCRKNRIIK